jgi:hypothetical protein
MPVEMNLKVPIQGPLLESTQTNQTLENKRSSWIKSRGHNLRARDILNIWILDLVFTFVVLIWITRGHWIWDLKFRLIC